MKCFFLRDQTTMSSSKMARFLLLLLFLPNYYDAALLQTGNGQGQISKYLHQVLEKAGGQCSKVDPEAIAACVRQIIQSEGGYRNLYGWLKSAGVTDASSARAKAVELFGTAIERFYVGVVASPIFFANTVPDELAPSFVKKLKRNSGACLKELEENAVISRMGRNLDQCLGKEFQKIFGNLKELLNGIGSGKKGEAEGQGVFGQLQNDILDDVGKLFISLVAMGPIEGLCVRMVVAQTIEEVRREIFNYYKCILK